MKKKRRLKKKYKILFTMIAIEGFLLMSGEKTEEPKLLSHVSPVEQKELLSPIKNNIVSGENIFGVPIYEELIDENTPARPGIQREIQYIVIHETDNFKNGSAAKNHATYLKYNNETSTSWHYTVDDQEIYRHIPDEEIAHHAGNKEGNEHGIGIELCVNEDGNFEKTFINGVKLVAYLLKKYNLTLDDIKTHYDMIGKDCPRSILRNNRLGEFKEKVSYYLNIKVQV